MILKENFKDDFKYIVRELAILHTVNHPNIVQFFGVCKHDHEIVVVTEYMDNDLHDVIYDNETAFDLPLKLHVMVEVTKALAYLTARGIVHRDVKSENVLVARNWTVKLCDFGFARVVHKFYKSKKMSTVGTELWMAPEVVSGKV